MNGTLMPVLHLQSSDTGALQRMYTSRRYPHLVVLSRTKQHVRVCLHRRRFEPLRLMKQISRLQCRDRSGSAHVQLQSSCCDSGNHHSAFAGIYNSELGKRPLLNSWNPPSRHIFKHGRRAYPQHNEDESRKSRNCSSQSAGNR